jgi:hypothetical protein
MCIFVSPPRNPTMQAIAPNAPKKVLKRRSALSEDDTSVQALKRRPDDFFALRPNTLYVPDPSLFVVIGDPNIFVAINKYKENLYICIRSFVYNQLSLRWFPSKKGLNLNQDEWAVLMNPRMIALIQDAIEQEESNTPPKVKESEAEELADPTSWPTEVMEGTFQHRHDLSAYKKVIVDRIYSPKGKVQVSLLQFDDAVPDPLSPSKGIHLSVECWQTLLDKAYLVEENLQKELKASE